MRALFLLIISAATLQTFADPLLSQSLNLDPAAKCRADEIITERMAIPINQKLSNGRLILPFAVQAGATIEFRYISSFSDDFDSKSLAEKTIAEHLKTISLAYMDRSAGELAKGSVASDTFNLNIALINAELSAQKEAREQGKPRKPSYLKITYVRQDTVELVQELSKTLRVSIPNDYKAAFYENVYSLICLGAFYSIGRPTYDTLVGGLGGYLDVSTNISTWRMESARDLNINVFGRYQQRTGRQLNNILRSHLGSTQGDFDRHYRICANMPTVTEEDRESIKNCISKNNEILQRQLVDDNETLNIVQRMFQRARFAPERSREMAYANMITSLGFSDEHGSGAKEINIAQQVLEQLKSADRGTKDDLKGLIIGHAMQSGHEYDMRMKH